MFGLDISCGLGPLGSCLGLGQGLVRGSDMLLLVIIMTIYEIIGGLDVETTITTLHSCSDARYEGRDDHASDYPDFSPPPMPPVRTRMPTPVIDPK